MEIFNAGCTFEHVYCSTATRAQMTIQWIAKTLSDKKITWLLDDDLYTFESNEILKWCRKLPDKQSEVVIIGHNPALTDFCNKMVGKLAVSNMPTSSYVQLSFAIDSWKDLATGTATLECFLKPKMFKD